VRRRVGEGGDRSGRLWRSRRKTFFFFYITAGIIVSGDLDKVYRLGKQFSSGTEQDHGAANADPPDDSAQDRNSKASGRDEVLHKSTMADRSLEASAKYISTYAS
jgi:hypothetical protein